MSTVPVIQTYGKKKGEKGTAFEGESGEKTSGVGRREERELQQIFEYQLPKYPTPLYATPSDG